MLLPLRSLVLLFVNLVVSEFLASLIADPERYDMKPGNIGRIQGDKNEPNPAKAEIKTVVSTTIIYYTSAPLMTITSTT